MTLTPMIACFETLRRRGWTFEAARHASKIFALWAKYVEQGRVKFQLEYDGEPYDMSYVDTWDDLSERQRKHHKGKLRKRIEREGVYGIVCYVRADTTNDWEHAASCWGFIGDDWKGEEFSIMSEALDRLDKLFTAQALEFSERGSQAVRFQNADNDAE